MALYTADILSNICGIYGLQCFQPKENSPDILALVIFQVEHKDNHGTCYFPSKQQHYNMI